MADAPEEGTGKATLAFPPLLPISIRPEAKMGRFQIRNFLSSPSGPSPSDHVRGKGPARSRDFPTGRRTARAKIENGMGSTFRIQSDALVDADADYLTELLF